MLKMDRFFRVEPDFVSVAVDVVVVAVVVETVVTVVIVTVAAVVASDGSCIDCWVHSRAGGYTLSS